MTKFEDVNTEAVGETYQYTCGYDANDDKFDDNFVRRMDSRRIPPGRELGLHVAEPDRTDLRTECGG